MQGWLQKRQPMRWKGSSTVSCLSWLASLMIAFWLLHLTGSGSSSRRHALSLLDGGYSGLDAEFAKSLVQQDILVNETFKRVPLEERTLDMDFRHLKIANSPLMSRQNEYAGLRCATHFPNRQCPLPGQCPPADPRDLEAVRAEAERGPCVSWQRGIIPNFDLARIRRESSKRKEKTSLELQQWDVDGVWKDPFWVPSRDPHKFRFYTPTDMHQCLAGKRILIKGDSFLRQFFTRLVQFSRSMPTYIEHTYTNASIYVLFNNGTDQWDFPRSSNLPSYGNDILFSVLFDWLPLADLNNAGQLFQGVESNISHLITGFNIWYNKNHDFSPLPASFDWFWMMTGWKGTLSYFTTPQPWMDPWELVGRNEMMRSFLIKRAQSGEHRIHVLPIDRLSQAADAAEWPLRNCALMPKGMDQCFVDPHWSPGFTKHYPENLLANLTCVKAPVGYDGRGIFNLAALQIWLNSIC